MQRPPPSTAQVRVRSVRAAEAVLRAAGDAPLLGVRRPWDADAVEAWLRSLAPRADAVEECAAAGGAGAGLPSARARVQPEGAAGWERVVRRFAEARVDGPTLCRMRRAELDRLCATDAGLPCLGHALRVSSALVRAMAESD